MKNYFLLLVFVLIIPAISFSQDVIVKKDGLTIECKVQEVGSNIIKYKRSDNLNGPDYIIEKKDISKIIYQNGTTDIFSEQTEAPRKPVKGKNNKVKKGYIGLTLGPAFPMGNFKDDDFSNYKAGLAKTGLAFNLINFGYRFSKNFGFAVLWNGSANLIKYTDDGIWSYGLLGLGFIITAPKDDLDVDVRFIFGSFSAKVEIPSFQFSASGSTLGYDIGIVARIHTGRVVSIPISIDFLNGNPELKAVNGGSFTQNISTLSVSTGVLFRLN